VIDRLRFSVILIILVAFAGGIWTRYLSTSSVEASTLVEINPALFDAGLQLTGTFGEPYGGLTGFEVSFPDCPHPLAILPVSARYTSLIPTEYHYGRGQYDISYVYNGNIYAEAWISYKLSLLNSYYRLQAFFSVGEGRQFAYYLKIWIPTDCPGISTGDVFALERALIGSIGHKEL
jgi:hypothetical protein